MCDPIGHYLGKQRVELLTRGVTSEVITSGFRPRLRLDNPRLSGWFEAAAFEDNIVAAQCSKGDWWFWWPGGLALAGSGDQAGAGVLRLDAVAEPVRARRRARFIAQRVSEPFNVLALGVGVWVVAVAELLGEIFGQVADAPGGVLGGGEHALGVSASIPTRSPACPPDRSSTETRTTSHGSPKRPIPPAGRRTDRPPDARGPASTDKLRVHLDDTPHSTTVLSSVG